MRFRQSLLCFLLFFGFSTLALALTNPETGQPKTFLGPFVQLSREDTLTQTLGFSALTELGLNNVRVGGTVGWLATDTQRLKLSLEYLWQRIAYNFFSGQTNQWVSQGALGGAYEGDLPRDWLWQPALTFSGFISHAPSKSLSNTVGQFLDDGVVTNYTNFRRIAGSNAAGVSPGVSIKPWMGGTIGLNLNYDSVRYDMLYGPNQDAKGFGGTVSWHQSLNYRTDFNILGSVRAPFNLISGDVGIVTPTTLGFWRFGIGSNYELGKNTLPDTYSLMFTASYLPNQPKEASRHAQSVADKFIDFLATPAVYLPQVLAVPDEQVSHCIAGPMLYTDIGDNIPGGFGFEGPVDVALNSYFTGNELTYTINYHGQPNNGSLVVVNGRLIGNNNYPGGEYSSITVVAHNACGSANSNTFIVRTL